MPTRCRPGHSPSRPSCSGCCVRQGINRERNNTPSNNTGLQRPREATATFLLAKHFNEYCMILQVINRREVLGAGVHCGRGWRAARSRTARRRRRSATGSARAAAPRARAARPAARPAAPGCRPARCLRVAGLNVGLARKLPWPGRSKRCRRATQAPKVGESSQPVTVLAVILLHQPLTDSQSRHVVVRNNARSIASCASRAV